MRGPLNMIPSSELCAGLTVFHWDIQHQSLASPGAQSWFLLFSSAAVNPKSRPSEASYTLVSAFEFATEGPSLCHLSLHWFKPLGLTGAQTFLPQRRSNWKFLGNHSGRSINSTCPTKFIPQFFSCLTRTSGDSKVMILRGRNWCPSLI